LSGNPSFRHLLRRVRDLVPLVLAHEEAPFEKVMETAVARGKFDENPLFNVLFFYTPQAIHAPDFGPVNVRLLKEDIASAKFDLTMSAMGGEESLSIWLEHKGSRFGQHVLEEMLGQFIFLLERIVEQPGQLIRNYPFL